MIAFTPVCIIEECTGNPFTSVRNMSPPLCPVTACMRDGSPTMTAAALGARAASSATMGTHPTQPSSSSIESAICKGRFAPEFSASGTAASASATKPFMSQVPRP